MIVAFPGHSHQFYEKLWFSNMYITVYAIYAYINDMDFHVAIISMKKKY